MSPPDTDELHSTDDLSQHISEKELHGKLGWLKGFSETKSEEYGSPPTGEDALFSQYLHSRSPSCFSAQGVGGHHKADGVHLADLIDQNTAKPKNIPVTTNKPRITLRIHPPKPGPKPKVLLRLSQPKQALAQKSACQGTKNCKRQRT